MASSLAIIVVSFLTVVTAAPHLPLHTPVATNSGQQYVLVSAPVLRTQYHAQDGLGQYAYGYSNGDGHYKAESKFLDGTVVGQYGYDLPGSKHVHVAYKAVDETPKVVIVQPVALGTVVTGETKSAASVYNNQDNGRVVDTYKQAIIVTDPVVPVSVVAQTQSDVATGSNYASEDVLAQQEVRDQNVPVNQYAAEAEMPIEEDQSYRQQMQPAVRPSYNAKTDEVVEDKSSYQAFQSASSASRYASSQDYNAPADAYDYPASDNGPTGGAAASSASAYASGAPHVPYGVSGGVSASASSSGSSYASSGGGTSVSSSVQSPLSDYAPAGIPANVPSSAYATGSAGLSASTLDTSADDAASYANAIDSNRRLTYAGAQEPDDNSYYAGAQGTSGYGDQSIRPVPLMPDNLETEDEPSYRPQNTASVRVHQSVPANENAYRLNAPVPSVPQTRVQQVKQSYYSEAASKVSANQSSVVAGGVPSVQVVAGAPDVQAVAAVPAVPAVAVVSQPQPQVAVSVQAPVTHVAVPVVPAPAVHVVTGSPVPVVPVVHIQPGHVVTHTQESHSNHSSSSSSQSESSSFTSRISQGGVPFHVVPNVQITKESSQQQQISQSHSSNKVSVSVLQSASPAPVLASANVLHAAAPVVVPVQTSIHIPVVSPILRKIVPASSPPPNYGSQNPQQRPSYGAEENAAEDYAPLPAPARNKY